MFSAKDVAHAAGVSDGMHAGKKNKDIQEYRGAALRVYRGDSEECWAFLTSEASKVLLLYKKVRLSKFLRYPEYDDPLVVSIRFDTSRRLRQNGDGARVDKIVTKAGLRGRLRRWTREEGRTLCGNDCYS